MLLVKIELHDAITGEISEIGRMKIINDGTGSKKKGNYLGRVYRKGSMATIQRKCILKNHPRLSAPVWTLVYKVLKAMDYGN